MRKITSTLFVLFILTLSLAISCKDKTPKPYCTENPGNCQSVLAAKDFFLFKVGSWWVYEEETTHERDSVYVYEYNNTSGYDFDVRVHSTYSGFNYHYYPSLVSYGACSESAPVQGKCIFVNRSKGVSGNHVGEGYCFFVNYKVGDYLGTFNVNFPNNKISVVSINETYSLNGFDFGKTVKIHELATVVESDQATNHFFAKNIGLVKRELLDSNQVWNLVAYHIES